MKAEKIMTVTGNNTPTAISAIMAALISVLLNSGLILMFRSVYKLEFGVMPALLAIFIMSVAFTAIHFAGREKLSRVVLIIAPAAAVLCTAFNLFGARDGLLGFLFYIQFYAVYWLPGVYIDPGAASVAVLVFIETYCMIAVCITTYVLIRRRYISLSLLVYVPLFFPSVANTTMLPDSVPFIVTATGVVLLLLTNVYRFKSSRTAERMILILSLPAIIFTSSIGLIFPQESYDKDRIARDFLTMVQRTAEDPDNPIAQLIDKALNGLNSPNSVIDGGSLTSLNSSVTNLKYVGPFNPSNEKVMLVRRTPNMNYTGKSRRYTGTCLYLKVESMDTYKDNTLSRSRLNAKVYKDDAEPLTDDAPYTLTITPLIDSSIDIVPYYTDFYTMGDLDYVTVNPYNTTTGNGYTYASSAVPVKNGNIYTKEYIENYVCGTALQVPKPTERALIMGGNLPSWYMDVYHGYIEMSDAEKVRKVTEFVSNLHPYSEDTEYPPEDADFVPWFVNEGETGICIHYAATSVVLLRLIGVPARYVRGFIDLRSYSNSDSTIYASQAHAWFEFFVPEYGWVMGDATPGYSENASNFNIDALSHEHPEIERVSFTRVDEPDTDPTVNSGETESGVAATPTPAPVTSNAPSQISVTPPAGNGGIGIVDKNEKAFEQFKQNFEAAVRVILIVLAVIAGILIVLGILRGIYVYYWRSRFNSPGINDRAVAYYHYYRFIGRIIRMSVPKKALDIAEKATFGRGEISSKELQTLLDECKKNTAVISSDSSKIRKTLYRLFAVRIRDSK